MNTTAMTPIDWAKRPFEKYADFSGRAPRAEFWWFVLAVVVAAIVVTIIESIVGLGPVLLVYGPLTLLLLAGTFVPMLAAQVRRLHDTNKSGLWLLAFYIPYGVMLATLPAVDPNTGAPASLNSAAITGILGLVVMVIGIVLLVFYVLPSKPGDNRYGPNPYGEGASPAATA